MLRAMVIKWLCINPDNQNSIPIVYKILWHEYSSGFISRCFDGIFFALIERIKWSSFVSKII